MIKIITDNEITIAEHHCRQEARLVAIETKLENKKEHIKEVDEDYYHLRDKLEVISENVIKLTTLLEENQKKENDNDKKIDDLKTQLANSNMLLKEEIGKVNTKIDNTNSSLNTLKWIAPLVWAILTFIVNYII